VDLVAAAQEEGSLAEGDVRRDVDLMLEAMEGLKLRAGFEPMIAKAPERKAIVEGLLGVFRHGAAPKREDQGGRVKRRRASGRLSAGR
jgi:hypothetical protein